MAGDLRKALEMISRHAAIAQGNRSFGHLKKIGGGKALGIEDGDEIGEGEIHGMPATAQAPGEALNAKVQGDILAHQDHQLPDDEYLPGSDPIENEPEPDEMDAPKSMPRGFMTTAPPPMKEAHGLSETAKRRRGRPRGSKA